MSKALDILLERLKAYDEVQILELLDLTTEDILERFKDRVYDYMDYLERELEVIHVTDDDEQPDDNYDGFDIGRIHDGRWIRDGDDPNDEQDY